MSFAKLSMPSSALTQPALQSYDFFLVLDVEATCQEGAGMNYPNEIIASTSKSYIPALANYIHQEWPVCLLGWRDKTKGILDIISEFRTFVKPTWRPELSEFCTRLTGITQV
jgi:3'-5' exoribonuclease 1